MHTSHYFSHFPTRSSEKKRHRPLTQYCLQCTSTGTFVDVSYTCTHPITFHTFRPEVQKKRDKTPDPILFTMYQHWYFCRCQLCMHTMCESLFQSSSDELGAMLSVNRCFNILIFPVILLSNATVSTA